MSGIPVELAATPELAASLTLRLLDASPDCVVMIDRAWCFRLANRRALALLGVPDLVGRNVFETFPGNHAEPYASTYRRAMDDGLAGSFEAYYPAPLNVWFKVVAEPDPDGIVLYFSDVTARREAERREVETADRLTQVLEVTSDAIFTVDRDWRFTLLNKRAAELIDPQHRALGKVMWEEFPALSDTMAGEMYRRTMNEGLTGEFEVFYPEPLNRWYGVVSKQTDEGMVVFFRDVTGQKEHDRLVTQQQELLHMVQRNARMATWELDTRSGRLTFGPGSFDLFGRPIEEVNRLGTLEQAMLPGHRERVVESVARTLETGEMVMQEFAVHALDGSVVWIETRGQAVPDGSGLVRGMSIDVTQRKLDQQELVASEQRYRMLTELNPQAIWSGDAAGNITYANQGFLAYIGLRPENLSGEGWLHAFAPADRERVVRVWTHSVTTGEDYDIEAMICHAPTSEYRYWHLRAAAVRDEAGAILQWLGVGTDIHQSKLNVALVRAERMEADHRRREAEHRRVELEAVYASTPVALALLDPVEFRFLNMNDLEADLLGQKKEDVLGRKLENVAPIPGLRELMQGVAADRPAGQGHGRRRHAAGDRRDEALLDRQLFAHLRRAGRGARHRRGARRDQVQHQKRAEAALIQSEKLAAVGRLASSISHEINNPLEAITNLLYLIAHDPQLPEDLKVYVHMAQSELSRVSQIATQTLRFHRQAVNPTRVTAADLVGAVVRLYTGRLANSNIRVETCYSTNTHILVL